VVLEVVGQFDDVTKIYARTTLIAIVTKISEFEYKVASYSVPMRPKSSILRRPEIFRIDEFNYISLVFHSDQC